LAAVVAAGFDEEKIQASSSSAGKRSGALGPVSEPERWQDAFAGFAPDDFLALV
jgi:hypothetical protein